MARQPPDQAQERRRCDDHVVCGVHV